MFRVDEFVYSWAWFWPWGYIEIPHSCLHIHTCTQTQEGKLSTTKQLGQNNFIVMMVHIQNLQYIYTIYRTNLAATNVIQGHLHSLSCFDTFGDVVYLETWKLLSIYTQKTAKKNRYGMAVSMYIIISNGKWSWSSTCGMPLAAVR